MLSPGGGTVRSRNGEDAATANTTCVKAKHTRAHTHTHKSTSIIFMFGFIMWLRPGFFALGHTEFPSAIFSTRR